MTQRKKLKLVDLLGLINILGCISLVAYTTYLWKFPESVLAIVFAIVICTWVIHVWQEDERWPK